MDRHLPEYLVSMVRRLPPQGAPVVPGSTPVVAFGDPFRARVATLGINPSRVEFQKNDRLLTGYERRLATLESLGADRLDRLTDRQVAVVVQECVTYFDRSPYMAWFGKLEHVLEAVGFSYFDGSACHLDLIQWATDPVWSGIGDPGTRTRLLDEGVPHLKAQLAQEDIEYVFVNGATVKTQVEEVGLATFEQVGTISSSSQAFGLFVGEGYGRRWLAWSANLQGSAGIGGDFLDELSMWVGAQLEDDPSARAPRPRVERDGSIPQGATVTSKRALVDLLRGWLEQSDAKTIGDVGSYGGKAWIHATIGGHDVVVNADTTRGAVQQVVEANTGDGPAWSVVANKNGKVNKVLPWPDGAPLKGWYAYLVNDLSEPTRI